MTQDEPTTDDLLKIYKSISIGYELDEFLEKECLKIFENTHGTTNIRPIGFIIFGMAYEKYAARQALSNAKGDIDPAA